MHDIFALFPFLDSNNAKQFISYAHRILFECDLYGISYPEIFPYGDGKGFQAEWTFQNKIYVEINVSVDEMSIYCENINNSFCPQDNASFEVVDLNIRKVLSLMKVLMFQCIDYKNVNNRRLL